MNRKAASSAHFESWKSQSHIGGHVPGGQLQKFLVCRGEPLRDDVGQEYSWNLGLAMVKEFTFLNRDGVLTLDAYHTSFVNQLVVDLYQSARELHFYALKGKSFSNSFQAEINYSVNRRLDIRAAYRFLDVQTKYKNGLIEKPLLSKHRGFLNIAYSTRKIKNRQ